MRLKRHARNGFCCAFGDQSTSGPAADAEAAASVSVELMEHHQHQQQQQLTASTTTELTAGLEMVLT